MNQSYPALSRYLERRQKRERTRVLVISPHPDDDVLGCGGTLRRLARRGAIISVIYVTDGSASHVKSKRFPPAVLRDIREGEARDALRALGITRRPRFLRAPDGRLTHLEAYERDPIVARIAGALGRLRPHVLFAPWQRDPHPDHIATASLVAAARARSPRRPATYLYGVWLTVRGTATDEPRPDEAYLREIVLAPAELDLKRTAILKHRSQTTGLVDDDPDGFRIGAPLLAHWLQPVERFYCSNACVSGRSSR